MTVNEFFIRLILSLALGTLIGIERQINGHSIGIRTNILVSLGTTMFILFPLTINGTSSANSNPNDTIRIAAQIITGVGFLGTGIIFKDGANVRGVNTAATIWCTAAIGILSGSGHHIYAIVATAVLIASNIIFRPIARKLSNVYIFGDSYNYYQISITCQEIDEYLFRDKILKETTINNFQLIDLRSRNIFQNTSEIKAIIRYRGKREDSSIENLLKSIALEKEVSSLGWKSLDNS
ncbi:MgtC/SapB family protein [Fusobacterium sp. PH5-44]|uniref:MgtC/SapB family protein n=1 Tax=unclassified Fusobacterium TaxID=2648384 RepID=UPI003D2150F5